MYNWWRWRMLSETGLDGSLKNIIEEMSDKKSRVSVKEENKFVGFDAYKKAIALADVVILATPPGFRPIHFEEAVNQGKQIFMEKPVATDPAGIQRVLAAAQIAKAKKLNVVVGLQRRYQTSYRELIKRVQDGAIGEIVAAQAWWDNDGVWMHPRQPAMDRNGIPNAQLVLFQLALRRSYHRAAHS